MKAMILAAGMGTRLGEIGKNTPKVLLDINGKTVLELIVEKLHAGGFEDILINVHHHAHKVIDASRELMDKMDVNIRISDETDELLDTGGGLYKARHFFDNEPFLVYNGDILSDIKLETFYNYHVKKNALATIAVRNREGNRAFLVDSEGIVRGWTNRKSAVDIITIDKPMELFEIPSMALTVYDPEIFSFMEEGKYSMTSIILKATETGRVISFKYDRGYWIDIGTPEKLQEAREMI